MSATEQLDYETIDDDKCYYCLNAHDKIVTVRGKDLGDFFAQQPKVYDKRTRRLTDHGSVLPEDDPRVIAHLEAEAAEVLRREKENEEAQTPGVGALTAAIGRVVGAGNKQQTKKRPAAKAGKGSDDADDA